MPERIGIIRVLVLVSMGLFFQTASGQVPSKKREVLSIASTSSYVVSGSAGYQLQQSVGQPGVTGLVSSHGLFLRQGFIQPPKRSVPDPESQMAVLIFPNPFSDLLIVDLPSDEVGSVMVTLTDVVGREVFKQQFDLPPIRIETVSLQPGHYILKVLSQRQHVVKLIKE